MHSQSKSERIHLRVTPEVKSRAEKWAERHDESVSAYVLRALQKRMDEDLINDVDTKITE